MWEEGRGGLVWFGWVLLVCVGSGAEYGNAEDVQHDGGIFFSEILGEGKVCEGNGVRKKVITWFVCLIPSASVCV